MKLIGASFVSSSVKDRIRELRLSLGTSSSSLEVRDATGQSSSSSKALPHPGSRTLQTGGKSTTLSWRRGVAGVGIMLRGNITQRRATLWAQQLPCRLGVRKVLIDAVPPGAPVVVVLDPHVPLQVVEQWLEARGRRWADVASGRIFLHTDALLVRSLSHNLESFSTRFAAYGCTLEERGSPEASKEGGVSPATRTVFRSEGPTRTRNDGIASTKCQGSPLHASQESSRKRAWKDAFACQRSCSADAQSTSPNADIAKALAQIADIIESSRLQRDHFRAREYRKLANRVKRFPTRIHTPSDLEKDGLGSLGENKTLRLAEILQTSTAELLERPPEHVVVMRELCGVWGIGPSTASLLIAAGVTSVQELRRRVDAGERLASNLPTLSPSQAVGLKRYEDTQKRIPREEVRSLGARVAAEAKKLCPGIHVDICGSYRRGHSSSGDVDVLIGPPQGMETCPPGLLSSLLNALRAQNFIVDDLKLPSEDEEGKEEEENDDDSADYPSARSSTSLSSSSYMGYAQLSPVATARRIDIKVYPRRIFAFALLYFTGSDYFNRSMRLFAKTSGWHLSDKGLCRRDGSRTVHCETEEEIFRALGLDFVPPSERNIKI